MLVGALVATGVVAFLTREEREYGVWVYLKSDVTEEQRAAVKSAMGSLQPEGDVEYEDSEQARERFEEIYKDMPEVARPGPGEELPESFTLTTRNADLQCADLDPIRKLPGVDRIQVAQVPNDQVLPGEVTCY
ncbi:hypothetical protein BU204_32595 [Actinophytocola xanthii]|uniref:FtsX extracellular domain-containing protein n=2 Tax=Actinophytocola xanthii TaxID=1912961 RepID=A0A1Q8C688_9PSEU|nr:hypothetical protein BU204_32595 [Actinophytocola xanthii]